MNYFITFKALLIIGIVICISEDKGVAGEEPPISLTNLANAMNFPVELLSVNDVTGDLRKVFGDNIIEAYEYVASKHVFAPISLIVLPTGQVVTAKLRREAEAYLARSPTNSSIRRLSFNGKAGGYSYSAAGPGGSEFIIALNIPSKDIDVQIKLSIPAETPLGNTYQTEAYHKLIVDGGENLENLLIICASQAVSKIQSVDSSKYKTNSTERHNLDQPRQNENVTLTNEIIRLAMTYSLDRTAAGSLDNNAKKTQLDRNKKRWLASAVVFFALTLTALLFYKIRK